MANWLDKVLPRSPQGQGRRNLPANLRARLPLAPFTNGPLPKGLPNASVVYGIAAAALFVIALYFLLFAHLWITGLLVALPGFCFLGFALHFLKYPQ